MFIKKVSKNSLRVSRPQNPVTVNMIYLTRKPGNLSFGTRSDLHQRKEINLLVSILLTG